MNKTYSCADELPEETKPRFLHTRASVVVPSPAFDLKTRPVSQGFKPDVEIQWAKAEKSPSLFIAHALSFASQRRVLEAYYIDAQNLSAEQLIIHAPFTILAVRQLISGSLINIQSNSDSLVTRNGIGFLLKVSPSCLYAVSPVDANVPMEKEGISQHQFREQLFKANVQSGKELNQSLISFSPVDLLSRIKSNKQKGLYNEIAFVPRTLNPNKTVSLVGVFIDSNNLDVGRQKEKGDIDPISFYFNICFKLSQTLNLPFFDLHNIREEILKHEQ